MHRAFARLLLIALLGGLLPGAAQSASPPSVPALPARSTYAYNTRGNLASITDANSHTTSFGYNALSQPLTETLPLGMAAISAYVAVGNLTSLTDFNGKQTSSTYDVLNRLTLTTPDASLAGQTPIGLSYFPTGTRKTMTDAGSTMAMTAHRRPPTLGNSCDQKKKTRS